MTNLKYEQLQKIFLRLTYMLRGFTDTDYENSDSEAQQLIRYAYRINSQPFQSIKDGISYVWVNYGQDVVSNEIFTERVYNSEKDKFEVEQSQIRKLEVHWIFYGKSAQDDAFNARMRIFSKEAKDYLEKFGIKLILDVPEVILLHEEVNNQWWPRVEFTASYYITTFMESEDDRIASMNIYLETEKNEYPILVEEEEE